MAQPNANANGGAPPIAPAPQVPVINVGTVMEEGTFIMRIENFDVVRGSDDFIKKQKYRFDAGGSIGNTLRLKFAMDVVTRYESEGGISGFLGLMKNVNWIVGGIKLSSRAGYVGFNQEPKFSCSQQIMVKNSENKIFADVIGPVKQLRNDYWGWGWDKNNFLLERDVDLKELPLPDGCLYLEVKYKLYAVKRATVTVNKTIDEKQQEFEKKSATQLSVDLGQEGIPTGPKADFTTKIVSCDGQEFVVNRGILSARSKVFYRMFRCEMRESLTGQVRIDDLTSGTVKVLLHYINSGALHPDWKNPEVIPELVYGAAKYELELLTEFLNDAIGDICTRENVRDLVILTNKLGMRKAEEDCVKFIREFVKRSTCMEDLGSLLEASPPKKLKVDEELEQEGEE